MSLEHDLEHDLAQNVANKVMRTFNSIKAGKPATRSNGVKEWSVMASVVMITESHINPITTATGVKALPDKVRAYSAGLMVHDMHAEILALRAFNRFLLDETQKPHSKVVSEHINGKFSVNSNIQLALLITEPPCGDASMSYIAQDKHPWESENPSKRLKVARGRNNFSRVGVVRTKPGRADSIPTRSKSCSDKLCLKQLTGINSAITSEVVNPVYLDYLILPEGKYNNEDMRRSFDERFPIEAHKFKVLPYELKDFEYFKQEEYEPSPLSMVYIDGDVHVIHNGVKNGGHRKNKPPKRGNESSICNYQMYLTLNGIREQKKDYVSFKKSQDRELVKERGREVLGEWESTGVDNLEL